MRKTKIIATIGPSSLKQDIFRGIIKEGADFIRINTAYSNDKQHQLVFDYINQLSGLEKPKIIFDIRSSGAVKKIVKYKPLLIALSFSETVLQFREIEKHVPNCKIIAKIESKKGVKNFDKILDNCWGVMVARGDLGRAVSLEKVPCLQKSFTQKTLDKKKSLIVATEMLLSMIKNPQPTRAEVSDVANAVFSKAWAVMLSEETAIGKNPIASVRYMRKIIEQAEKCL